MHPRILLFLLLLGFSYLPAQTLQDSTLYGLNFENTSLRFASADIRTGGVNLINATPTSPDQFSSGVSDINPFIGEYYYIRAGKVYSVDGTTGTVLHSPTITCATDPIFALIPITNIAYNWLDGELYGLHFYNSSLQFAKVNRTTGVMTIISPAVISPDQFGSGVSDIDPVNGKYYYIRANRILTVDLTTGTLLADMPLSNPNNAIQPITNIAFNTLTGKIYGLNFANPSGGTSSELRLASVNPTTGTVTLISQQAVSADQFQTGVSDLQPSTNLYSYVRGIGNATQIISVDLSTGLAVHDPLLQNPNGAVSPITNIAYRKVTSAGFLPETAFETNLDGLTVQFRDISRFSSATSWDFGDGHVHTDQHPAHTYQQAGTYQVRLITENGNGLDTLTQTVTVNGTATSVTTPLSPTIQLYPQPATDQVQLVGPQGTYQILNLQGVTLKAGAISAGSVETLDLTGWPAGLYWITGVANDQPWRKKLVIQ